MEKNNKIWFKRKRYGWGWRPSSWQGWLIMFVYFLIIFIDVNLTNKTINSSTDALINFAPKFIVLTVALIIVCYLKGEKPKWSWGDSKK